MYRKDYIQRQFEEFGKVLATILGFKHQSDWDKFEKEIELAARQFTALDLNDVEQLSDEAFELEILNSNSLSQNQKKILASLLFEKLSLYLERNDELKSERLKNRCLKLYRHLQVNFTDNQFDLDTYYKLGALNKM